jgi:regulatory protein
LRRAVRPPRPLDPERAWEYALWLLGRQAMSAAEMRARLRRRSLPDAEADRVVARLEELGLLDDAAFAEGYVQNRAGRRGRLALRRELLAKGVAEATVEASLAERDETSERAAARDLLAKQAWRFAEAHTDDATRAGAARSKAYALLARRGFAPEVARAAVEAVLGEHPEE